MYQYSLEWYVGLFNVAIDKADKKGDINLITTNIMSTFTAVLYENVCRSLFEKDKLLFSFLLCTKILTGREGGRETGAVEAAELRFFLQGALSLDTDLPNPTAGTDREWLTDKAWADLCELSKLPGL